MQCHLLITFICAFASTAADEPDDEIDLSKYAEMASSFLSNQNADSIGGLINNFMQGSAGKNTNDANFGAGSRNGNNMNQILQGIASLFDQQGQKSKGFDPSMIGNVLNFLGSMNSDDKSDQQSSPLSFLGDLLQQEGGLENIVQFLPLISSTINSFTGEEAKKREERHAEHEGMLPPILEHVHVAYDHFINSDLGQTLLRNLGTEKFAKAFSDDKGNFDFEKFLELLENHSFRKMWIELVTKKVAGYVTYFADPTAQRQLLMTVQYFINSVLKSYGLPKNAMFDSTKPTESLTSMINHILKHYFQYKVDAREYVKPAVKYIQDLIQLSKKHGYFGRGFDTSDLSHKLADTINLEIIEPGVRVYRAYRFAKRHPKCDRYVMCLLNQNEAAEKLSLPGLKRGLSMSGSLVAGWFLSRHTETPFMTLFHIVTAESNCQLYFSNSCSKFHVEELKVTKEYVHNEL